MSEHGSPALGPVTEVLVNNNGADSQWRWSAVELTRRPGNGPVEYDRRVVGRASEGYVERRDCEHGLNVTLEHALHHAGATVGWKRPDALEHLATGYDHATQAMPFYRMHGGAAGGRHGWTIIADNGEPLAVQGPVNGYETFAEASRDLLVTVHALLGRCVGEMGG